MNYNQIQISQFRGGQFFTIRSIFRALDKASVFFVEPYFDGSIWEDTNLFVENQRESRNVRADQVNC